MAKETFYKDLLDNISDGIYFVDVNRRIKYWNKGAEQLTGYTASEMIGKLCADNVLSHVDQEGNNVCFSGCPLTESIKDGHHRTTQLFMHHKDGHRVPVQVSVSPMYSADGLIIGAVEVFRDSSSIIEDKETIEHLKKAVLIDPLTGIGNRRYIEMQLVSLYEQYTRYNMPFGVLMIDIDDFKTVNDSYGHDTGDSVLKMVANTLAANMRASDFVGRYGGEEFLGLLPHVDEKTFYSLAERLRMLVDHCFIHNNNQKIHVTVTVGAAFVKPGDTPESIVKRADELMYSGKQEGKNRVAEA